MKYMLLIYSNEKAQANANVTPAQQKEIAGQWMAYDQKMKSEGVHVEGNALQPTATATSVRVRSGDRVTTDGPFAETKEQLGGYYIIDCKDLDGALDWAAQCPGALTGTIEVRPVMSFE